MNKKALLLSLLCFTSVAMRATEISNVTIGACVIDAQNNASAEEQAIVTIQQPDIVGNTIFTGLAIGTLSGGAIAVIVNTILDTILNEKSILTMLGTPYTYIGWGSMIDYSKCTALQASIPAILPIIKLMTKIGCKQIWGNALNEKLVAKAIETDNKNHYKMFNEAMLKTVSRTTAWILIVSPITLA
jgi:hypothetical protein